MLFFFGMRHQRIVMEKRPLEKCSPQSKENLASVPINGEAARTKHSRQIFVQRKKAKLWIWLRNLGHGPFPDSKEKILAQILHTCPYKEGTSQKEKPAKNGRSSWKVKLDSFEEKSHKAYGTPISDKSLLIFVSLSLSLSLMNDKPNQTSKNVGKRRKVSSFSSWKTSVKELGPSSH